MEIRHALIVAAAFAHVPDAIANFIAIADVCAVLVNIVIAAAAIEEEGRRRKREKEGRRVHSKTRSAFLEDTRPV